MAVCKHSSLSQPSPTWGRAKNPFDNVYQTTTMTMTYILNQQPATDPYQLLRLTESDDTASIAVPATPTIVPLTVWQAQGELHSRSDIGVWLENTTEPENLDIDWNRFPVIALDYPKFTDGRSHSIAYLLRNRLKFTHELRAIGDVLVDQLFYMKRVGFNAFSLRADQNIDTALRMLGAFSQTYQGSTDEARPLFARAHEDVPATHDHGLGAKINALEVLMREIAEQHAPAVLANSLAFEDMVLTDVIARLKLPIELFTLQTGMLHAETSNMVKVIKDHYGLTVREYTPDEADVAQYISEHGKHAFYESVELRKACCHMRKVKPLQRALVDKKAWLTGQRSEQSVTRTTLPLREFDAGHGLEKFNPLRDWTFEDVKQYIQQNQVPYNPLHDQGYPSIGCEPCTRAIKAGEDIRAGRWWWESSDSKECGLHVTEPSHYSTHEDKVD